MDPSATAHEEGEQPVAAHSTERQQGSGELSKLQELRLNLNECNWEQLEERYADAMNEHSTVEESLQAEMAELLEVFTVWSQVTAHCDETRALKRFKTQMQHVQVSEEKVEEKRKHYVDVVRAFESALALLNDKVKV